MFLFAFNLYTQINLFVKHIFTNKFITTPYYIYGGVPSVPGGVLGGWWCPRWLVVSSVAGGAPWWLVVPPGILARIFTAGHPDGHATRLLSAAGSLASESKLQGEIDRCDYSYYQLFRCSFRVCFYIAMYRLKH